MSTRFLLPRFFLSALSASLLVFLMCIGMVACVQAEPADFALPDTNGKTIKLSDFRGKWVVVNYWATWCPPCQDEIPDLVAFHENHKNKDAVVLGVDFEDVDLAELHAFIGDYFITYPIVRSKPAASSALGPIEGLPTSFIIAPNGEIMAQKIGPVTGQMIEDFMKQNPVTVHAK